jgi:acyl-CoA dehydrogenase
MPCGSAASGLVSLAHAASRLAVAALDGDEQEAAARTIGARLLARDIVGEIRDLLAQAPPGDDATSRALAAFDLLSSVARQPRKVQQIRLGNAVWSEKQ